MKRMNLQIQPALSLDLDVDESIARLRGLAVEARITEGEDSGLYINVDFKTDDLTELWSSIQGILLSVSGLASAAIVACEGENGWYDYLLLHHFDPDEPVDQIP